jgi:hypothetical protein
MRERLAALKMSFDRFLYQAPYGYRLALFRTVFLSVLFIDLLSRQRSFDLFFTETGFFSVADIFQVKLPDHQFPFPNLLEMLIDPTLSRVLHTIYVVLVGLSALGVLGRSVGWLLVLFHVVFFYRNPAAIDGSDFVCSFWLFYLSFAKTNDHFSILNYFRKNKTTEFSEKSDFMSSAAFRLVQIQLCIIYGYTGLEKVRGITWWRGDAVWNAMANSQMVILDLGFMRHLPEISIAMSYLTVLWEVYFPVLVWNEKFRPWMLALGIMFHGSIAILFGLPDFSLYMLSAYFLFIPESTCRWMIQRIQFFIKYIPIFLKRTRQLVSVI